MSVIFCTSAVFSSSLRPTSRSHWMNGMTGSFVSDQRTRGLFRVFFCLAVFQLLMSGKVHAVRAGDIIRNMLPGVDEVEPWHLAHNEEDILDAAARGFRDGVRQAHREFAFLLPGSAETNIAS